MMKALRAAILLTVVFCCTACSANLVPVATPSTTIDPENNTITGIHDGVRLTVGLDAMTVSPYQQVDNISSFYITIFNQTDSQVTVPIDAFVLKDASGRQYRTISPEQVTEIISRDSVYLIPYPYVGYYYLEDQARQGYVDETASALPFYAEYHPQELYTRALPVGPVLPGSKIAGVIYFIVDMTVTTGVELLLYSDGSVKGVPDFRFPFAVE
jgi:hypothetical protein